MPMLPPDPAPQVQAVLDGIASDDWQAQHAEWSKLAVDGLAESNKRWAAALVQETMQAEYDRRLDAAVRAFLKLHHPLSWRLWLQNRDKRQLISPLDLGDIRKLWRDQAA